MPKLNIVIAPDPVLKTRAKRVETVDARLRRLMDDMVETMYAAPGIGLAAPQIGVLERVIVLDVAGKDEAPRPMRLANPEIVWSSEDLSTFEEGCLSIPEQWGDVTRPAEVRVRYLDENNETREVHADGALATCLQHEIAPLDGILFVDHLSPLRRNTLLRSEKRRVG